MKAETKNVWTKFKELVGKFNQFGYKKKDNYPNLPETPRLQRTTWLGKLLYTDGVPVWKFEPFAIAKDRWGQLKDIRWFGNGRFVWNFSLYAVYFHFVLFLSNGYASGYGQQQAWAFAATLVTSFFWLMAQTKIGEIQNNEFLYDKPKGKIVTNKSENVRFTDYIDYHLRDFLVKMIYPVGYVIIAWSLNGGTFFID